VPGFAGLGAPYWVPRARGALIGLTAECGLPEIARATLEAVGYQTRDLVEAMTADSGVAVASLRVEYSRKGCNTFFTNKLLTSSGKVAWSIRLLARTRMNRAGAAPRLRRLTSRKTHHAFHMWHTMIIRSRSAGVIA
jgi:hypothetical protein